MYTGGFDLAEGRNFTLDDVYSGRNYTILGSETKQDLFGDSPAAGKTIRIQGKPYLVIGTLAEKDLQDFFWRPRCLGHIKLCTSKFLWGFTKLYLECKCTKC
jgi:hypothetical protein